MRWELKILLGSSAFSLFAMGLLTPLYAVFVEQIGGGLLLAGISFSAFAISGGVIMIIISRFEDQVKHQERLIAFGYLLSSLAFIMYIYVDTATDLIIAQVVLGLATAVGMPAYDGIYSKYLDPGKFVSEWGAWDGMSLIVQGIAAVVGAGIASTFGFRTLFIVMLVLSVIALAVSCTLLIKRKKSKHYWKIGQ